MSRDDKFLQRGGLSGATDLPVLTYPTIRARVRRHDPDGVRSFPYYPTLTGKTLVVIVRPSPGAGPTATINVNFGSDGYDDAITAINTAGGVDLKAYDDGGYLVLQSLHGGGKNTLEIDASGTGNAVLGFDPLALGGFSQAGDVATASAGGAQANPHGTVLMAHDESFTSAVLNRALTGSFQGLDQIIAELDHEIPVYQTFFFLHLGGASFNLGANARLATEFLSNGLAFNQIEIYDLNGNSVYSGDNKTVVQSITYGAPVDPSSTYGVWGTPDGKSVANPGGNETRVKTGPTAITEIRGNLITAPGAQFVTNRVQPHDTIRISGATNDQPFDHNGEFTVVQVADEDHVYVRPKGPKEPLLAGSDRPRALNANKPGGTVYGNLTTYVGFFVPFQMKTGAGNDRLFFNTNGGLIAAQSYYVVLPVGVSLRDMWGAFSGSPLAPIHLKDPDIAYQSRANTFKYLNTFYRNIAIGSLLNDAAGAQVARIKSVVTAPASSDYTLVREDTRDFPNLTVARHYTFEDAEGVHAVTTINARWIPGAPGAWAKDLAGVPASKFHFRRDRINFQYREADANWSDSAWTSNPMTVRATAPAFTGEAQFPTFIAPAMASASTAFTLVFDTESGDVPGYKHRMYVRGTDGRFVFTANARWTGTQWARDVGGVESRKIEFSDSQIWWDQHTAAGASPWNDNAWNTTNNTIYNRNATDPGTLSANNKIEAGEALSISALLAVVPRIKAAMATAGVSAKTLMWETTDASGTDDKVRFYMGRGVFELTINAKWSLTGGGQWSKDVDNTQAAKFEFIGNTIKYSYRDPTSNGTWADNAWSTVPFRLDASATNADAATLVGTGTGAGLKVKGGATGSALFLEGISGNDAPILKVMDTTAGQKQRWHLDHVGLPTGRRLEGREEWNQDPAEMPGAPAMYRNGLYLPDHHWLSVSSAGLDVGVKNEDPTADFPWAHVSLNSDSANGGYAGFRSAAKVVRVGADSVFVIEGEIQRMTNAGDNNAQWDMWWGVAETELAGALPGRYALFATSWNTGGAPDDCWKCISKDNVAEQSTNSTVALPTTLTDVVKFRIEIHGSNTDGGQRVRFYINGAFVASHSTRVPTGAGLYVVAMLKPNPVTTTDIRVGPLLWTENRFTQMGL